MTFSLTWNERVACDPCALLPHSFGTHSPQRGGPGLHPVENCRSAFLSFEVAEEEMTVFAPGLGFVHGCVGLFHQLSEVLRVIRICAYADARAHGAVLVAK